MLTIYLNDREVARIGAEVMVQSDLYLRTPPPERIEVPVPTPGVLYDGERITAAERFAAGLGHRITAIKSIRQRTNLGLHEAKALLDAEVPVAR